MTKGRVAIVGTGFVADLYMRSLASFPEIEVVSAYDIIPANQARFCRYWNVRPAQGFEQLLSDQSVSLVLNLTNPASHFAVSKTCLNAGKHVYSEKPLALDVADARELCELAAKHSLELASAPCSLLGEAAQTAWQAVRTGRIGTPYLVYAELDDDLIPRAPYTKWHSESGAPWPYQDEFAVGCTLEHAGYYLTWLIAMFGSITRVISAAADLIPEKPIGSAARAAPDFSCATLYFESGTVARLTCSIIASHDHRLRIFGEDGILEIARSWDNNSPVKLRRRYALRRKLITSPIATRIRLKQPTHPKVGRWGAASMNFALGPAEVLSAINESRPSRLSSQFALHLTEATLAIQQGDGVHKMSTRCPPIEPMGWAQTS
ncbi:Gfo/Idh/MocA family protein [Bradyrhizobium sp. AZCC 2230]|uniref:Gfo/Idh/MocA family protein n=1 Tax=Bradyrhizobium sp. AZCC 2230 TaxID=3117021 RepID=UPI002FEF3EB8